MGNMDLGVLILAGVCGIGVIQLIMWIVLVIRHPGVDDFRFDLVKASSAKQSGGDSSRESHSARVEE